MEEYFIWFLLTVVIFIFFLLEGTTLKDLYLWYIAALVAAVGVAIYHRTNRETNTKKDVFALAFVSLTSTAMAIALIYFDQGNDSGVNS